MLVGVISFRSEEVGACWVLESESFILRVFFVGE